MNQLVPLIGLLVAACAILYLSRNGILEQYVDSPLTPFIQANQPYYNPASDIINPIKPQLPLSPTTSQNFIKATISADYNSSINPGTTRPLQIPSKQPDGVVVAQTICERINTDDCDAFNNPEFAANCGIALDVGTNTDGKPHLGGLYFNSVSRESQKLNKNIINGKDYNTYTPTLGTSKMFATDKDMCLRKKVDLKCKQSKVIGEGNSSAICSLCFTDSSYHGTVPNAAVNPVTVTLYSNANYSLAIHIISKKGETWDSLVSDGRIVKQPIGTTKTTDGIPLSIYVSKPLTIYEGDTMEIICRNVDKTNAMLAGFIKASTVSNPNYQLDMTAFMSKDHGLPVLQNGTVSSYFLFIQQEGQDDINLRGIVPFTFTKPPSPDANNCSNGPFITQKASMDALNADGDCYNSENSPGNYPLACLKKIFRGMGGTANGTGYPSESNKQTLLYDPNGNPRSLGQITDYLGGLAVQASTGLNNGVSMSIPDWNNVSMFMTGKAISNPCETKGGKGPITTDCLNFLYTDPGTYGTTQQNQSLDSQDFQQQLVCRPEGALSPSNPDGLARAKAAALRNGRDGVKALYKSAFQTANNTSLSNQDRKQSLKDCYGVKVLNSKAEVFWTSDKTNDYNISYKDAPALCAKVGGVVASVAQLDAAQASGSQMCACGWTADDERARYPMQQTDVPGCGSPGSGGLVKYVKVSGGADYLSISQLVIKDKNGTNVAPSGTTSSSGNWGSGSSEKAAIDGTQASRPFPAEYHSKDKNAFFQVTLANPTQISSITIYNRADCCQQRLAGYKISLLDSNNNVLFTSSPLTADTVQTISVNLASSVLVTCGNRTKAGVYCYGPKPDQDSIPDNVSVRPFSETLQSISAGWLSVGNIIRKWSEYS
jgi:hypothetical protein